MNFDLLITQLINSYANPFLDNLSRFFGTDNILFLLILLFIAIYVFAQKKFFLTTTIAVSLTIVLNSFLKLVFNRPRPDFTRKLFLENTLSFPSTHAAASFSIAVILSHYYPKQKYLFYLLATLVSFTRVYSGVHYVSDVIVGAGLGVLVSVFIIKHEKEVFKCENLLKKKLSGKHST
ncbi:MAG: phosphatase PAP2 family protein [Nanoarchaeota archaeon]|nr:phosphatase PAP2 family protein [Nanoarchaeota archaeon]